jgi:hypothetical protein
MGAAMIFTFLGKNNLIHFPSFPLKKAKTARWRLIWFYFVFRHQTPRGIYSGSRGGVGLVLFLVMVID